METIFEIKLPFTKIPSQSVPWHRRLAGWNRFSLTEFGGKRVNTTWSFHIARRVVLRIQRNEFHVKTDEEHLSEISARCLEYEKELRGLRLLVMGDSVNAEVKKVIRDSLGVDLDEGTIR